MLPIMKKRHKPNNNCGSSEPREPQPRPRGGSLSLTPQAATRFPIPSKTILGGGAIPYL